MVEQQGVVETRPTRVASLIQVAGDYVSLTKPPIISLLLVTAVGAMFLAAQGPRRWS